MQEIKLLTLFTELVLFVMTNILIQRQSILSSSAIS